jgi:hypothetical protein
MAHKEVQVGIMVKLFRHCDAIRAGPHAILKVVPNMGARQIHDFAAGITTRCVARFDSEVARVGY